MNRAYWKGRLTQAKKLQKEYRKRHAIAKAKFDKKNKTLLDELNKSADWLKANCPHIEVEKKERNVSGGLLHKGYHDVWYECSYCGEKSITKRTQGSYE